MDLIKGLGTARVTIDATAGGVSLGTLPAGAIAALIRVKTAAVCFTDDGTTAPTASVGQELEAGDSYWCRTDLAKFKAIRRDSTSATLVVTFYGPGN